MEKPKIVAVSEKKAVNGRPGSLPVARQQRELTGLEKSVLEEMRKRGEQAEIDEEVPADAAAPKLEETDYQTAPQTPAVPPPVPPAAIEVADEAKQPPIDALATSPAKPRVVQRVWPAETEELIRRKRAEEARKSALAQTTRAAEEPAREMTAGEKAAAAERAQKIYAEKQAQSSIFARLKRLLRLA